jgi:hypothetical protein
MRRLAAALMGVALASTVGLAQSPNARDDSDRARAQEDLRLYHAALDAYAEGDAAKGVAVLADPAWTEDRLRRISEVIGGAADPRAPWTTRRYGAAVLVHADVARSTANVAAAMLHVDFAANLIRRGLREHGDALRLFAEHWFVAMSGWLRGLGALDAADRMLKTARDQLPDNAGILYVSGTLAELLATEYAAAQSSNDKCAAGRSRSIESPTSETASSARPPPGCAGRRPWPRANTSSASISAASWRSDRTMTKRSGSSTRSAAGRATMRLPIWRAFSWPACTSGRADSTPPRSRTGTRSRGIRAGMPPTSA